MRGIETQVAKQVQPKIKNGVWAVFLTDPRLNKFTFGPSLIGHYLMTDIISPYGQKSVKYSTLQYEDTSEIVIKLNFEEIDDCNITDIALTSNSIFFQKWKVTLVDNRDGSMYRIEKSTNFEVEPPIRYNKLFGMGFIPNNERPRPCFFELRLQKK